METVMLVCFAAGLIVGFLVGLLIGMIIGVERSDEAS
jgi:LytS/YehU family sensor histidine kinase